ncbi:autotransporter assembly complex family protein [uncultured Roseovarius sp.]|uniref:autotransporter assembly complex protein TamA n=1 Tax=uncultured Roseovarius sp. TaxID=293344 RepID=UPI002627FF3E|nr:autotransporter assembly complex family protein [uncultured Roseovarius sp.]
MAFGMPVWSFDAQLHLTQKNDDLRESLSQSSLVLTAKREEITAPLDILSAAQADYGHLVSELYARGYFGPVVKILVDGREAATIPPLAQLKSVKRVMILIKTGPAFKLGQAQITPVSPDTVVPEGFAPGQPARTGVIADAAGAGIDGWRDLSYAKARVVQQSITANHAKAQLNVSMLLDPGPAVTFGQINVPNNSKVRKDRIRRIAGIPRGKPFDPLELERAAKRLRRTGAFSSVTLREAETLGAGDTMDIELDLVDAKPRRFGFGAEVESTEGVTLSGFWMHRNLFGGAERLRIEAEFAGLGGDTEGVDTSLSISLTRPSTFDSDTDLYALIEVEQLDEELFFSDQVTVGAGINHYYSEELEAQIGLAYRYSDVSDELGNRTFTHLTLPLSATWDKRDDELDATEGFYLAFEGLPYYGLDGSESGARAYGDARGYWTLGDSKVVLATRVQLGTIIGSSLAGTPSDLLFLSGGSGTVRGQSFQSLSVLTGTARTGGRSFVGLAGEARFPLVGNFSGVAFYDIGYVGRNSFPDDTGDWHSGAGLGARYKTAFGPVRFDVAVPVTGPDTSGFEFYIGIGQAF